MVCVVLVMDQAYVTLATNDSYAIGAVVLGHSLRNSGTTRSLVVMVTNEVTDTFRYVVTCVAALSHGGETCSKTFTRNLLTCIPNRTQLYIIRC